MVDKHPKTRETRKAVYCEYSGRSVPIIITEGLETYDAYFGRWTPCAPHEISVRFELQKEPAENHS